MKLNNDMSKVVNKNVVYAKWILGLGFILVIIAPYILTRSAFFQPTDFTATGQIGDTIGGITAPIVNLIAALLVYLALNAQTQANGFLLKQISDQNEQFNINRINEIIYSQLNRIDQIIKHQPITISDEQKSSGYSGILFLNKFLSSEEEKKAYNSDYQTAIDKVIASNLESLGEIYEILSSSVGIIANLIASSGLSDPHKSDLQNTFLLNLNRNLRDNPYKIKRYLLPHHQHPSDLANEYSINLSELKQLVYISVDFFDKTVDLNENLRSEIITSNEAQQIRIDNKSILSILDVVALLTDLQEDKVQAGQVGTIVEELADGVFEVEFADKQGRKIAMCAVEADKLLKLTHEYVIH